MFLLHVSHFKLLIWRQFVIEYEIILNLRIDNIIQ